MNLKEWREEARKVCGWVDGEGCKALCDYRKGHICCADCERLIRCIKEDPERVCTPLEKIYKRLSKVEQFVLLGSIRKRNVAL